MRKVKWRWKEEGQAEKKGKVRESEGKRRLKRGKRGKVSVPCREEEKRRGGK